MGALVRTDEEMTRKFAPAFGCMTAVLLLAACGSSEPAQKAEPTNPNAAFGDAEMAAEADAFAAPAAEIDAAATEAAAPAEEAAPAAPAPAPAAQPAAAPAAASPAPAAGVVVAGLTGDAAAGKKAFTQCGACHSVKQGENRVGPALYGIVGEKAAAVPNFKFSKAMTESNIVWTADNLFKYLEKPSAMVPGTTMAFAGIADAQRRVDLVAYIAANGEVK